MVARYHQRAVSQLERSPDETQAGESRPQRLADSALAPGAAPTPAERIGKYLVLDILGQGAMGLVVRAFDPSLARTIALKIVHPHRVGAREEAAKARLVAEARALARVSHPNVVAVYEVGTLDALVFVAMELVVGVDLSTWLRSRPREWREIVELFIPITRGLAAVHAAGLVHRDIKPANILVGDDGRVRVGDFGIARAHTDAASPSPVSGHDVSIDLSPDGSSLTAEGMVVGTPAYMAPEQHLGADVGPAADQYALCVALYEALYRRRPFALDPLRLLAAKRRGVSDPPDSSDVPRWLFAVIARGLQADPAARYPDILALGAALARDPAKQRRRIAAVVTGALALSGVAGWAALKPGPCDDAGSAIDAVWNADVRERITAAYARSTRAHAAGMMKQVADRFDERAASWRQMAADNCVATRVRDDQSDKMFDRRVGCLDARRRELLAATELLAQGGDDVVDRTPELLATVRPVTACGDLAALEAGVPPLDDADLRARVDAVRAQNARGIAARTAGRVDEAVALASEALAAAESLGYDPLVAETLYTHGFALELVGHVEQARAALERSVTIAISSGADLTAAEASDELAWLFGEREKNFELALHWADLGRAFLHAAGDDPVQSAALHNTRGAVLNNSARWDEAIAEYETAITLAQQIGDTRRELSARTNIANTLFLRGQVERARALYEEQLPRCEEAFGADHYTTMQLRVTLAMVMSHQGELADAEEIQRDIVERQRRILGPDAFDLATSLDDLGTTVGRRGRPREALALHEEALRIFERGNGKEGIAIVLNNLGSIYRELEVWDAAERTYTRALATARESFAPDHPAHLMPVVGLALVRVAQARFADAEALVAEADKIADKNYEGTTRTHALILGVRADLEVRRGNLERGLALVIEKRNAYAASADKRPTDVPYAYGDEASILLEMTRPADALAAADAGVGHARRERVEPQCLAALLSVRARALTALGRDAEAAAARQAAIDEGPPSEHP